MEIKQYVLCNNCVNERGISFDAWCDLGLKCHRIDKPIVCDSFKEWKPGYNKNNKYTDIEVNETGMIVLWKGDKGQKFTSGEFLRFLNDNIKE